MMLLQALLLSTTIVLSYSLPFAVRATGEWEACSGQAGVCIDVNTYTCSWATLSGKCPGLSNIRCCPYPSGVVSSLCGQASGVCTRTENCGGTVLTGKCPGPSAITCCTSSECTLGTVSGCSTDKVSGLTRQLGNELKAMGISFSTLSDTSRFRCSAPCEPYLQSAAKNALSSATLAGNDYITLNSAYRSSAQQYLLYTWYLQNKCSISLAAKPGTSQHESGPAIDTSSYSYWRPRLESYGWKWLASSDPVHFDCTAGGNVNVRKESLRAFQRLWNRNNPADKILEDGVYGSSTAQRLRNAPCNGW